MYARDENEFNARLEQWEQSTEGIMVKSKGGDGYICLSEYCKRCWYPVREMWARYERKTLPVGCEHTTNRLERCFGVLKADLKVNTTKEATIEAAIKHIVSWATRKLVLFQTAALRKDTRIFHSDPKLQEEFNKAALCLNRTGCLMFKRSVDLLQKNRCNLAFHETGVLEKFSMVDSSENSLKLYTTTELKCNCSRFTQDAMVCRHILFLRESRQLSLFEPQLFSDYYHQQPNSDHEEEQLLVVPDPPKDDVIDDPLEDDNEPPLDSVEKYKIAKDLTEELRELVCHFGTEQFAIYMYELEILKRRVRRGQSMLNPKQSIDSITINDDNSVSGNPQEKSSDVSNWRENSESVRNSSSSSYESLRFLEKIKSRGRPKRTRTGRLSFPKSKKPRSSAGLEAGPKQDSSLNIPTNESLPEGPKKEIVINDDAPDPIYTGWKQVCMAPPGVGQVGENIVTKQDYSSLAPGKYITDSIINWRLRELDHLYNLDSRSVLVLSTCFYERLKCWSGKEVTRDTARQLGVNNWLNSSIKSANLVLLPVCWQSHFYLLVAILDTTIPSIQVLESIGGPHYGAIPPMTEMFGKLLLTVLELPGVSNFVVSLPVVPRQTGNDCGLFCMTYAEIILKDPVEFILLVSNHGLADWFSPSSVLDMRQKLAERIQLLSVEQRKEGGPMCEQHLDSPLPSPSAVMTQVIFQPILKIDFDFLPFSAEPGASTYTAFPKSWSHSQND